MRKIIKNTNMDYTDITKAIKDFKVLFPFLQTETIGKSCGGRDITAIKIGRSEEYVLFTAAFHGSEHITANLLLMFVEDLCNAIKGGTEFAGFNVRRVMTGRSIIFVPLVNPDGAEISIHGPKSAGRMEGFVKKICKGDFSHWNANLRGVDINHNFNADWDSLHRLERQSGIYVPSMTRFGGYRAESEPETKALVNLCHTYRIRHAIALHSQGEVIYWDYGPKNPPRAQKMAEIMATASGYELSAPEGLAVGGGFKDWFIKEFNRPAFTVEVGKGENPLPSEDCELIYRRIAEMLVLCIAM